MVLFISPLAIMTYLYLPSIEFVLLIFCNIYFYILIDSNNIINRYSTNKLHLSDFDNTFAAVYKYCYSTNMCKSSDILESIRMINRLDAKWCGITSGHEFKI